ncbi:WD repeat-containing protein 43-like [Saccoglossus kowalevskii]|uniref:WD repeat-containing protein 43-like n=1 Tax=Saccoglossus kowalevskii TaxID=10224 RepID=A0ABM0M8G4_SACKO|nr:PREDICTED: WD repeat-containing protein 43-like [Saccoglossus kowalevskii]
MASNLCVLSPNSELLAVSSPDGRLKLWDTTTGTLNQQYTPSSHLSATCTCVAWSTLRESRGAPRRKKRKSEGIRKGVASSITENVDLLALGTSVGSILLYSAVKGDLQSKMDGGHADTVNCLCWHLEEDSLYSCSDDHHITEWSVSTGKVKCKWKGDKSAIHCISICPGGTVMLSAARTIKVWNLKNKELLKRYTGHASPVSQINCVPMATRTISISNDEDDALHDVNGLYFLSTAVHDRVLNAWHIKSNSKDKNAVAAFSLIEEPISFDVAQCLQSDQSIFIAVLTRTGQVQVFDPTLNGKSKKPIKPRCTVQVATQGSIETAAKPLPIVCVQFCKGTDNTMLIGYGTFLKPVFEKVCITNGDTDICLIREDPTLVHFQHQDTVLNKVKTPLTSEEVKIVTTQHFVPMGPQDASTSRGAVTKRKTQKNEVAMEDRLNAISLASQNLQMSSIPQSDSLVLLLTQGLQSQDKQILSRVLKYGSESLITNTVKRLPVQLVVLFAEELALRINSEPERGTILLKWVKALLTLHASYLSTFPEVIKKLSTLYQMMDTRVLTYTKLSRLRGRLSLMMSQISSQTSGVSKKELDSRPAMLYLDSSDEADEMDELLPSHSESEGEWEELSDMDAEDGNDEEEDKQDDSSDEG